MTVRQLREHLTHEEFVYWNVYHGRRAQRQELERLKAEAKAKAPARRY